MNREQLIEALEKETFYCKETERYVVDGFTAISLARQLDDPQGV